jgi:phosphoketolase
MPGVKGICFEQQLTAKLCEHKQFNDEHGQEPREIRNWKWSAIKT